MNQALIREYERHCSVIDENNWPRNDRRKLKSDIKAILQRDGYVNPQALTPEYRWNLCSARLRDRDFTNWDGWEFRSDWAMTFRWGKEIKSPVPKWNGGPCSHLVVLGEQGIGDEIMFLSALPELMVRVGSQNLEVQTYPRLQKIVERSFKVRCTDRKPLGEVKEGEAIVALGDLFPFYRRDESHFPKKPFLKPDPEKVKYWKDWLSQFPGEKIGYAYKSRHGFHSKEEIRKAAADVKGDCYVFDLQYDSEGSDKPPFDTKNDFENLFAFVSCLDRVVTVTQTLAHVAGSLGKECHAIIPPKNGDITWYLWYWGTKTRDALIYPNMTVYKNLDEFRTRRA